MLKSNSKKAQENIKNYILNNFDFSNYEDENTTAPTEYNAICKVILETMNDEKFYSKEINEYEIFKTWCQGLPSILDTCYYYNRSAVNDLKEILEETEAEASKFTEQQAEERLTYLLYREIKKHANK